MVPSPEDQGGPVDDPRPRTAEVFHNGRGLWEVLLPDEAGWRNCETLRAATCIATRWAQDNPPSEVIVRDAYHRVMLRTSFRDTNAGVVN